MHPLAFSVSLLTLWDTWILPNPQTSSFGSVDVIIMPLIVDQSDSLLNININSLESLRVFYGRELT